MLLSWSASVELRPCPGLLPALGDTVKSPTGFVTIVKLRPSPAPRCWPFTPIVAWGPAWLLVTVSPVLTLFPLFTHHAWNLSNLPQMVKLAGLLPNTTNAKGHD